MNKSGYLASIYHNTRTLSIVIRGNKMLLYTEMVTEYLGAVVGKTNLILFLTGKD
jgi:hypothetical protein